MRSSGGAVHSRVSCIRHIQNIDFPELDGPAMIAVNVCMNLGSVLSRFIVGNLEEEEE